LSRVVWVALLVNTLSAILKVASTMWTNSTSVFVDVLNDTGDSVGLGLILLGLKLSKRSKSVLYPYGARRALYVLGLIAISIFSGVIFATAVYRVLASLLGDYYVYSTREAQVLFAAAFTFNLLYLVTTFIAEKRDSNNPAIEGTLIDAVSDFLGSALALVVVFTSSTLLDIIGGLAISLIILISALTIGYKYYQILVGRSPPKSAMKKALVAVLNIPEVKDVNVFNAMMLTEDEYMLVLEVEVDKVLDIDDLESLSARIESAVKSAEPRFKHVIVEFVAERKEPKTYESIIREIDTIQE